MSDQFTKTVDALTHSQLTKERTPQPPSVFAFGELLDGCYEVQEILGSGGMGQVFAAIDRDLDRKVAIKGAWPGHGENIRREARALAALRHPSMVAVHTIGRHLDVDYMVMERIFGTSLHTKMSRYYVANERMPIDEVLDILLGLGDAMSVVHEVGLAHLDLKPSNVMLAPRGRIVLMDFGIAEAECSDRKLNARPAGTVPYMAPEVIQGHVQRGCQYFADVYAYGVLAYQLMTGHLPYEGPDPSVIEQHVRSPIPNVRDVRPEVPVVFADLARRLLAKSPGDRPANMEEVLGILRQVRRQQPIELPRGPWSVLIVDDDSNLVRSLRRIVLDVDGTARIRCVGDAEAGLTQVREDPPDAILLDLNMPKMNGLEMCMWLSGTHLFERCPTVLMSATATDDVVGLARQLGVEAFVDKNLNLLEQVEDHLTTIRARWNRRTSTVG